MREIRSRARGANREHEWVRRARRSVPAHLQSSVGRLRASMASLRSTIDRIGQLPPSPPTFRGRMGASVIRLMQRMMFWFTPSVQSADRLIVDALEAHLKVTEEILAVLEKTNIELARVAEAGAGEAPRA